MTRQPELTPDEATEIEAMLARLEARLAVMPAEREHYANLAAAAERHYSRPHRPARRADEGTFEYSNRSWRWEMWYRQEPRPCHWFAGPEEIAEYRAWRIAELRERGYDEHGKELP